LTAFVREVVLPGGPDAVPRLREEFCRFRLEHGPSAIHRWGIFARETIPARRRVIQYTGERIDKREVQRRSWRENVYFFGLNQREALDGAIGGSGAEYINHSCEPNLYARVKGGVIWLVSLRRIAAGEELLLDYRLRGFPYLVPCYCGAASCRGYMNEKAPAEAGAED
jgi:SET domain-containing protein